MKGVGAGVVVADAHKGYLDLTAEALENLIRREPITDHYEVEHTPFARGKFAAVRRARCLRSGTWFAAKVMRKRRRAQDVRHEILHEAAVLLLARPAPTIVSLHQLYETTSEIILLLELAEGGELQRVIDEEESVEEEAVQRYMSSILASLRFLHSHNVAHLDLKPQNLLLMGHHPESEVKLCDFGISRVILSDIELREVLGTPDYVAPEILQYEPISLSTDMWSVGVLTYVLLTGHSPFGGDTKQETFLNISQGRLDFPEELFEDVSDQAVEFISRLLVVDPRGRMTVDEALQHTWLSASPIPASAPAPTEAPPPPRVLPKRPGKEGEVSQPAVNGLSSRHNQGRKEPAFPPTLPSTSADPPPWSGGSPRPVRDRPQELHPPSSSSSPCSLHPSPDASHGPLPPSSSGREDGPWHKCLNKENNKNSLNKTEEITAFYKELNGQDSPSKPRGDRVRREAETTPKKLAGSKEGKENKEHGKDLKEAGKEKLRPSPLCLRRQGSKCDLKSPSDPQKFSPVQGGVNIILEKSIIC